MWELAGFFVGVIGGLAGIYIIGFPITILLAVLLAALSRRHGKGAATLLSYAGALVVVDFWSLVAVSRQDGPPRGVLITSAVVLGLAGVIALSTRLRLVRGSRR